MEAKAGILMLLSLAAVWSCGAIDSVSRIHSILPDEKLEVSIPEQLEKPEKVCTFCEQSVAHAMQYFNDKNTQQKITAVLHSSCSSLKSFSAECSKVVDYYVPMFFFELAIVKPDQVCHKLDLCEVMEKERESILTDHNICATCRENVSELLKTLNQRDTQLAFIETLGFGCKAMPTYIEKCVPMAYEYVPRVFSDIENFFGATDVCATSLSCKATSENKIQEPKALNGEPLLSMAESS